MNKLNSIELKILDKLSLKYPSIKQHIPLLRVLNREITGIGMYVNFYYVDPLNIPFLEICNTSISTNEDLHLDTLKYGLAHEVDITNCKINFIEFVTYGENWDGSFLNHKWSDNID